MTQSQGLPGQYARRTALQYSQEYMAVKMGVGQNCYSKIELGENKLTVERLLTICRLLELDAADLLQRFDSPKQA